MGERETDTIANENDGYERCSLLALLVRLPHRHQLSHQPFRRSPWRLRHFLPHKRNPAMDGVLPIRVGALWLHHHNLDFFW